MDSENLNGNLNDPLIDNENNQNNINENQNAFFEENYSQNDSLISQEELARQNLPFMEKITERELTDIMKDIIPSLFFISIMLFPLYYSPQYCDYNIYISMYFLISIYIGFIAKGLLNTLLIYFNKDNKFEVKIFLMTLSILISLSYYICIYLSYIIYTQSNRQCFKTDTLTIFSFFSVLFMGIISFAQKLFNFILLIIVIVSMIKLFNTDSAQFFSQYGIDPDFIRNLPTTKADDKHTSTCVICLKDIVEGDDILILHCPGGHYFHSKCIKKWLLVKSVCPMCKDVNIL